MSELTDPMSFVITGASGYLGQALCADLHAHGHHVSRLVRRPPLSAAECRWDPARGVVDRDVLAAADVIVNLSGASVGRPWTSGYKRTLRSSRLEPTSTLARALAAMESPPLFVSQSAVGYYGGRNGALELDESCPAGDEFVAVMASDWEAATDPAEAAGVRVIRLRTGVVLGREAPAFRAMTLPFQFGIGGRLGSGEQYFGGITLTDWLAAVRFLVQRPAANGPYNLTLPVAPTNAELTAALGAALHRPTLLSAPAALLRVGLGDLADELLGSHRTVPRRLLDAGFSFTSPNIESAVADALRPKPST